MRVEGWFVASLIELEGRRDTAVICFNNRNSLIYARRTKGIHTNGGHNSSFFFASASRLCQKQLIEDNRKTGIWQEPTLHVDNIRLRSPHRSAPNQLNRKHGHGGSTEEYMKELKFNRFKEEFNQILIPYAGSSTKCSISRYWLTAQRSASGRHEG